MIPFGMFLGPKVEPRGADCTMLCHFDGTNGSTVFTDETGLQTWNPGGNAKISTTASRFGGSSLYLDGSGDYIIPTGSPAGLAFGTADYTIDFWFNGDPGMNGLAWDSRSTSSTTGRLLFGIALAGIGTSGALSSGVWYHYARTRASGTRREFLNGVQVSNAAETANYGLGGNRPAIGADGNGLGTSFYKGYLDEYHVQKGTARWTSSFTLPVGPYV